jgi:hypothetical protein
VPTLSEILRKNINKGKSLIPLWFFVFKSSNSRIQDCLKHKRGIRHLDEEECFWVKNSCSGVSFMWVRLATCRSHCLSYEIQAIEPELFLLWGQEVQQEGVEWSLEIQSPHASPCNV